MIHLKLQSSLKKIRNSYTHSLKKFPYTVSDINASKGVESYSSVDKIRFSFFPFHNQHLWENRKWSISNPENREELRRKVQKAVIWIKPGKWENWQITTTLWWHIFKTNILQKSSCNFRQIHSYGECYSCLTLSLTVCRSIC